MTEPSDDRNSYWQHQNAAMGRFRKSHSAWSEKQRANQSRQKNGPVWKRETFSLPRSEARKKAQEFFDRYPKAAYWSEVECWRELPGDMIEFTMRRLPTAD